MVLGKIRPSYIKRIAKVLTEKFPNVFTASFEEDKKLVGMYTNVESKRVRNRIAGYVASIVRSSQYEYVAPEEEEFPEDYEEYELTKEKEPTEEQVQVESTEEEAGEEEAGEEEAGEEEIVEEESLERGAEEAVEEVEEEETVVEEEPVKKSAKKKQKAKKAKAAKKAKK
ncbi:MAG: 30S ribosomal protein S17e [Candidatus Jordarchaeaceae archaeon]